LVKNNGVQTSNPSMFHGTSRLRNGNRISLRDRAARKRENRRIVMKREIIGFVLATALLLPGLAGAVTEEDFKARTTQEILNLCTASPKDPLYTAAVNFCHGFLVGAYRYYAAENSGPGGERLVCFSDPPPTRDQGIAMFIEWAKAHPEFKDDAPVDAEFRFLMEKWPCKK
jgi:hypothetical protein